jgi:hypothetical protein
LVLVSAKLVVRFYQEADFSRKINIITVKTVSIGSLWFIKLVLMVSIFPDF